MPKPKIFSEVEMVNEIDNKENKISHEYEEFLEHIIKIFFLCQINKKYKYKAMIMYFVHSKSLEYNDEIVKIIENPFDN